jgi:hypothetical protein
MVTGLLTGFGTMALMLFENVYLQIKEEGIVLHDNGKETTIPWDTLEAAERREGFVVLKRKNASALEWFAGSAAADVAKRVDEARRKAVHGLHPPRS